MYKVLIKVGFRIHVLEFGALGFFFFYYLKICNTVKFGVREILFTYGPVNICMYMSMYLFMWERTNEKLRKVRWESRMFMMTSI